MDACVDRGKELRGLQHALIDIGEASGVRAGGGNKWERETDEGKKGGAGGGEIRTNEEQGDQSAR